MPNEKEQKNWLLTAIRFFSLFTLSLLCFPPVALYFQCFLHIHGISNVWQYQLLCTVVCFAGWGISTLFQKLPFSEKRRWMCDFLAVLLGVLPLAAGLAAGKWWFSLSNYTEIPAGPYLLFPWILGIRAQGKEYHSILDRPLFTVFLVEGVSSVVLYVFNHEPFPLFSFVLCLLILSAAYGVSRNQGNLDFLMERRGHSFSHLPARIRYYNIRLLAVILAGMAVFFLLCFPIASLVQSFFELIRQLIASIPKGESYYENGVLYAPVATPAPEGEIPAGSSSPWWNILTILIIAGLLVLLIRNGKKILRAILDAFQRFLLAIRRVMTRHQFADPNKVESEYYVDEDIVVEEAPLAEEDLTEKQRLRRWKRQYRQFRRMPEGSEKLRLGYGLAIAGMKLKNFPLSPGDTPLEVLDKTASVLQNSHLTYTTPVYNQVRYDTASQPETGPSLGELQAVLEELEKRSPLPKVSHRLS